MTTWGGDNLFLLTVPFHSPTLKEVRTGIQGGIWKQELKQKPWNCIIYRLAPCGLLSLLFYFFKKFIYFMCVLASFVST